ncbi:Glycosyltransferase involved in cell wall bisynthesis [Pedobacter terrae]|uniref:Glycosyltransferase involved in cell wall bisynthesis n=1 Tax=Pedobacter terrae TaxID=405671 RepID=A0A1G8BI13_9SPHI|nr:glycosyltransferase [Pedobacter terrae]SDH32857.1 Glycosyltransferase involved in cell wall bisynthesis [Pedobacter terrae]
MEPLISIALCTYNGANFLPQQLDSILNQTYKNIELVIVDDGSSDGTKDILKQYAVKHEQIKLYFNEKNIGFNANFQKAIAYCLGDFIAISDQDDIWLKNKLELLYQSIGNNWLIFSNSSFINEQGEITSGQLLNETFSLKGKTFKSLLFSNFVTGHTSLFSKKFKPFLFPIPKEGFYDWWMGFIAIYHQKITYLAEKLTLHRIHNNSVMYKLQGRDERYKEIIDNLAMTKNYKNLDKNDERLIYKLFKTYSSLGFFDKIFLVKMFFTNYHLLFPDLKPRHGLSRLNYALKLVRKTY